MPVSRSSTYCPAASRKQRTGQQHVQFHVLLVHLSSHRRFLSSQESRVGCVLTLFILLLLVVSLSSIQWSCFLFYLPSCAVALICFSRTYYIGVTNTGTSSSVSYLFTIYLERMWGGRTRGGQQKRGGGTASEGIKLLPLLYPCHLFLCFFARWRWNFAGVQCGSYNHNGYHLGAQHIVWVSERCRQKGRQSGGKRRRRHRHNIGAVTNAVRCGFLSFPAFVLWLHLLCSFATAVVAVAPMLAMFLWTRTHIITISNYRYTRDNTRSTAPTKLKLLYNSDGYGGGESTRGWGMGKKEKEKSEADNVFLYHTTTFFLLTKNSKQRRRERIWECEKRDAETFHKKYSSRAVWILLDDIMYPLSGATCIYQRTTSALVDKDMYPLASSPLPFSPLSSLPRLLWIF